MGKSQIHDDGGIIKKGPQDYNGYIVKLFYTELVKHIWVYMLSRKTKWITKFAKKYII